MPLFALDSAQAQSVHKCADPHICTHEGFQTATSHNQINASSYVRTQGATARTIPLSQRQRQTKSCHLATSQSAPCKRNRRPGQSQLLTVAGLGKSQATLAAEKCSAACFAFYTIADSGLSQQVSLPKCAATISKVQSRTKDKGQFLLAANAHRYAFTFSKIWQHSVPA